MSSFKDKLFRVPTIYIDHWDLVQPKSFENAERKVMVHDAHKQQFYSKSEHFFWYSFYIPCIWALSIYWSLTSYLELQNLMEKWEHWPHSHSTFDTHWREVNVCPILELYNQNEYCSTWAVYHGILLIVAYTHNKHHSFPTLLWVLGEDFKIEQI